MRGWTFLQRLDKRKYMTYSVRTLYPRGMVMTTRRPRTIRTRRINLRATDRQEKLIRTGAEKTGVSVTDFNLYIAGGQAEHVLAEEREFVVSRKQWQAFAAALDRPAQIKPELAR